MTDFSDFDKVSLEGATYYFMPYTDEDDADFVLTRPKRDGGELTIEVARHLSPGHRREGHLQDFTFLRVRPLAEVPGYNVDDADCSPNLGEVHLANLRPGHLYVFLNGTLWRELAIDGQGRMSDVDLARHRAAAAEGETPNERPDEGEWQESVLVPVMISGKPVHHQVRVAYSEIAWSWDYIQWLQARPRTRLNARTQDVACAYTAYLDDSFHCGGGFRAEQIRLTRELRERDLGVELMLGNPAGFDPEFTEPASYELCAQLAETWKKLDDPPMEADAVSPRADTAVDTLDSLRKKAGVVSVAVPDPLFRIRHSLSQLHLALHYLDALDQSLTDNGLSRSAVLIRQALFDSTEGPLTEYRDTIDREKLDSCTAQSSRRMAARRVREHVEQLARLVSSGTFTAVLRDFTSHHDLGLCEAHGLVADMVNLLQQLPGVLAAQGESHESTRKTIVGLLNHLLSDEALLELLTPAEDDADLPEHGSGCLSQEALKQLADDQSELTEDRLNGLSLQGLGLIERNYHEAELAPGMNAEAGVYTVAPEGAKQVAGLVQAAVGGWSEAVLKGARELMEHPDITVVRLDSLFAGVSLTLQSTQYELSELRLMRRGEVDFTRYSIIGVHGKDISFGLSRGDRQSELLTGKKDYLYGDLINEQDQQVASTSPGRAFTEANDAINRIAGTTWVFVLPVDSEPARRFSQWRLKVAEQGKAFVDGPGMSRVLVGLAVFNLANEAAAFAKAEQDAGRILAGVASAALDLVAASMKLHLAMNQNAPTRATAVIQRPLFDMKNWFLIGPRLQKVGASTLVRTLGLANFLAGATMVGTSVWDLRQSLLRGDPGAIQGHALAVSGGLVFLGAPLLSKLLWIPGWGWAVLGLGLVIGGTTYATREGDDAFARMLRQGPLGTHPDDTLGSQEGSDYYPNLLTLLSPTAMSAEQYSDWKDRTQDLQGLPNASPDDYVVTVSNPLISRLRRGEDLSLDVEELVYQEYQAGSPEVDGNRTQYHLQRNSRIKEMADWVPVPGEHAVRFLVRPNVEDRGLLERLAFNEHHRLRVGVQFRVNDSGLRLTLPAPSAQEGVEGPFECSARLPRKERRPLDTLENEPVPYWAVQEISLPS